MNVREAAAQVLREAGKPLHASDICDRLLKSGLWSSTGKTPAATVAARLYTDIKNHGDASAFVLVAPQTFGLREMGAVATSPQVTRGTKPIPSPSKPTGPRNLIRESLSFTDAAEKVLERFGGKQPMHYREITDKAQEMGWLKSQGKTPEATMYALILSEIRRHQKRGEQPRFVQHGRGIVGLSRWMGSGLAFQIEAHNRSVREALHKELLAMEPSEFEELIGRLLAEIGFEDIEITGRSGDGGIDVRGTLVVGEVIRTQMAVQVKRWKPTNRVHAPIVQQVRGSLGTHEQGLIITTSDFSNGAREEAMRPNAVPVALMNGEQLVALLIANDICITRRSHDIIELGEETTPVEGE